TVTLLVSPEQSRVLADLEAEGKLHLSLVYRGTPANTAKFIELQDKVNADLYPTEQEESQSEQTPPAATPPTESEVN
ncbi:MAG: pilus assembly protein CpaB, partial [Clostridia bacterium]